MNEEVQLELTEKNGFFHIDINGRTEAKMTFVFAGPNKIIIDHTEVNEGHNGKGFGKKLMQKAIDTAEGNIALHVEPDNPAKGLYEKLGFTNKYLEMRLTK